MPVGARDGSALLCCQSRGRRDGSLPARTSRVNGAQGHRHCPRVYHGALPSLASRQRPPVWRRGQREFDLELPRPARLRPLALPATACPCATSRHERGRTVSASTARAGNLVSAVPAGRLRRRPLETTTASPAPRRKASPWDSRCSPGRWVMRCAPPTGTRNSRRSGPR